MFVVLYTLLIYFSIFSSSNVIAQFYNSEPPWQFAGFAAVNVPAIDNNVYQSYPSFYSPFQQQLQLQQLTSNNRLDQQQQQQSIQQQSLITAPHNPPLLPSVISIPKRENGNSLKLENVERETEIQQGDFRRESTTAEHATYLSLINDKENFHASGCGWDLIRLQCHDLFGLCKGGCRDFAIALNSPIHDCRCIPFGYLALVKLAGK